MHRSLYDILDLSPSASREAIETSYRRLLEKFDPAQLVNEGSSEARFRYQAVRDAYHILGNEARRAAYDRSLEERVAEPEKRISWRTPAVVAASLAALGWGYSHYVGKQKEVELQKARLELEQRQLEVQESQVAAERARAQEEQERHRRLEFERARRESDLRMRQNQAAIEAEKRREDQDRQRQALRDQQQRDYERRVTEQRVAHEKAEAERLQRERLARETRR